MLFNSYEFILVFLPVTVSIFFILGKYSLNKFSLIWLVISSLFFYAWWNPMYLLLICSSIIFNYLIGVLISNTRNSGDKSYSYLVIGVMFNLLLLGYYKYSNFFVNSMNEMFYFDWNFYNILLPIGISFFTFQQIAYLVGVSHKKTSEHNFLQYSLFVVFFPQLIAGPIVHHRQILPQFTNYKVFTPRLSNLVVGLSIFFIGLFKKVVLADGLSEYANPVFSLAETGQMINFFQAWTATIAYSLQLYLDFSGYSDMAIGLARIFGIALPMNFYSPYKSKSIIEFWQRWHMTLSRFLRDYVYIPLGGNKKGKVRRYINIILTMLLGGLWHGAAWTFVAWGVLHGFYIVINHLLRKIFSKPINKWWSIFTARLVTFILISIAWVLFRSETFFGATQIYKGLYTLPSSLYDKFGENVLYLKFLGFSFNDYYVDLDEVYVLLCFIPAVLLIWVLPNTQQIFSTFNPAYDYAEKCKLFLSSYYGNKIINIIQWRPTLFWSVFMSVLFVLSFMSLTHVSEFLYFQF